MALSGLVDVHVIFVFRHWKHFFKAIHALGPCILKENSVFL